MIADAGRGMIRHRFPKCKGSFTLHHTLIHHHNSESVPYYHSWLCLEQGLSAPKCAEWTDLRLVLRKKRRLFSRYAEKNSRERSVKPQGVLALNLQLS